MNVISHRARLARALVVALVIGVAGVASAQPPARPAEAQPSGVAPDCPPPPRALTPEGFDAGGRDARDRGFLWRIRKDGRTSHLYGTIHAARYEWMFPGPTLQRAIDASATVALELDMLDPDIQRRLRIAVTAGRAEPLPDPLAQRMARLMAAACMDAAAFAAFPPEFQLVSLAVAAARQEGLDPAHAVDLVLAVHARRRGVPVVSLETPELQVQAIQMPTREQTIEVVERGLAELDSGRARPFLRRIGRIWSESDYDQLARYEEWCDCLRTEAERLSMRRLLDDRNPGLADRIDALHAGGRAVFAAVGSLHMIGSNGLPALMQQRGYEVERVGFGR